MPLTPKQQRFCEEYLIDLNGTQAAIRAGYSPRTANEQACHQLAKVSIQAEIQRLNKIRQEATGITPERVIQELGHIAFANPKHFFNADGKLKPLAELPDSLASAIAGFDVDEEYDGGEVTTTTRKVKFWSKTEALLTLAKHFQLLTDRVKIEGNVKIEAKPQLNLTGMNVQDLLQLRELLSRAIPATGSDTGRASQAD